MFFFWTPGMPLLFVLLMALGSLFVFYCFVKAICAIFGSDEHDAALMDRHPTGSESPWRCPRKPCRAMNTSRAKYCRMCGASRTGHSAQAGL